MANKNETFFSRFARDPLNADVNNVNLDYTASVDYIVEVPAKVAEVKATGTVTLVEDEFTAVTMITVDDVEVMSAGVNYNTNIATTAAAVVSNINAHTSDPNYIATNVGGVITIEAVYETGVGPNGFVVVDTVASLANTPVAMANGVTEVLSSGTVTLSGTSGDITGITVNAVEVMNGTESFDTDLETTAAAIVASIIAKTSSPNYTAANTGAVITILAIAGTGTGPNTFVVDTTESGGDISAADVAFSGGVAEVLATGTITFTGEGACSMVSVNGVDVMSGPEAWDSDLTTTIQAVADNITAHTSAPDYNGSEVGGVLTITAVATSGATPNGFVLSDDTVRASSTDMAGGVAYVPYARLVINRLILYIEDTGTATVATYGADPAWTNGTNLLYEKNGVEVDILDGLTIKTNADIAHYCYDVSLNAWGAGKINVLGRWTFSKAIPGGITLRGTDKFIVRTNIEDMTGVTDNHFCIQGYYDEDEH
jgi:hypothetical protein